MSRSPFVRSARAAAGNPFMHPRPLPFEAPPFNLIKDANFKPAIDAGSRRERAEITPIADNPAPPSLQNTRVALERSGRLLNRVVGVFNALISAHTGPTLQKVQAEEAGSPAVLNGESGTSINWPSRVS